MSIFFSIFLCRKKTVILCVRSKRITGLFHINGRRRDRQFFRLVKCANDRIYRSRFINNGIPALPFLGLNSKKITRDSVVVESLRGQCGRERIQERSVRERIVRNGSGGKRFVQQENGGIPSGLCAYEKRTKRTFARMYDRTIVHMKKNKSVRMFICR